jgi:group I intron endonuclease
MYNFKLTKLTGIYQIKNKINNKKYIGKSNNITLRWSLHIGNLFNNEHPNTELQKDFNTMGIEVFEFSILELSDNNLINLEQKYINDIDLNYDYNMYNATKERPKDLDTFIKYVNDKWLIKDKDNIKPFKIYKIEDKKEIIETAINCNIINDYPSRITFNRIIRFMGNTLGYIIEDKRGKIDNIKCTYKLIIDFDENYLI